MYFSFWNERKLALGLLCLVVSNFMQAQLREPFTHLQMPSAANRFFFPQSFNNIRIPDPYSDTSHLSASQCAALFMSMSRASLDSTHILADFSGFREQKDSVAHSEGYYALALLDIEYFDFHPDALVNEWIYLQDGNFYHSEGCTQSPCLEREALVLWVDAPHITSRVYHFRLNPSSFISNYSHAVDSLFIDFDDGEGWRVLSSEFQYQVDYTSEERNRIVRCKAHRNGKPIKYASCVLKHTEEYDVCASSSFPLPDLPPWSSVSDDSWDVVVQVESETVMGRAYTLMSEDGVFDKPFVFVEGIDFGLDRDGHPIHDQYRHGTFGWCEFTSGFQDPDVNDDIIYGYDDLHLMPELLQEIRNEGYDIVLVDFYDGATWLQHNSAVVQQVIRLCNENKSGSESLVIAGASMGGVITRHALRSMELNGEDHCARLWISMDAPHEGAHIPLALQYAIGFSAEHAQEQAQLFRDRYLLRPAAKQMLDAQVFHPLHDHDAWYDGLREMGYPEKCRSVAVSNGLSNGHGLSYESNALMDWECTTAEFTHSKMLLLSESGDAANSLSISGFPLLAHMRAPIIGMEAIGDEWYFWLGSLLMGIIDVVDVDEQIIHIPSGLHNRDYAPGGKRSTMQTFAASLNSSVQEMESNFGGIDFCDEVNPTQYNPSHAFVLTTSAVGIVAQDPYVNIESYLWENPDERHFDRYWFAEVYNENHTELTHANVSVVLEEVLSVDHVLLDTALTSSSLNDGVFNYGRPEYPYLHSIHVHDGGRLHINAMMNTHFNGSMDYLSQDNHFEASTLECTPATILIDGFGEMHLGDPTEEYRTAEVTIRRDSRLVIGSTGKIILHPGSTLIIEEGAVLEVQPGGYIECTSANLVIRSGGKCEFRGSANVACIHDVVLLGNDARWVFDGGQLHIADNTTVRTGAQSVETGYIEILPGTENMLHMEVNSVLHIEGSGMDDAIVKIRNGAHLQNANWMQGSIELWNGLVDLTYNGAIYTDAQLHADNVHFFASDLWEAEGSEVWVWSSGFEFSQCRFEHVQLHSNYAKCTISECKFFGPNSGFEAQGGLFSVISSTFKRAPAVSNDLELPSTYANSVFQNNSYIYDWSEIELPVTGCSFENTMQPAIEKFEGALTMECNRFNECGPVTLHYGILNVSADYGAGTNSFENMLDCISLEDAQDIRIENGYNDFSGCVHSIVSGTIDTLCDPSSCELIIESSRNHWGYSTGSISSESGLLIPPSELIHLQTSQDMVCSGYENSPGCYIQLSDKHPIPPVRCIGEQKSEDSLSQTETANTAETISCVLSEPASVDVWDASGRRIVSLNMNAGEDAVHALSGLAEGIYFLSMKSKSEFLIRQLFLTK